MAKSQALLVLTLVLIPTCAVAQRNIAQRGIIDRTLLISEKEFSRDQLVQRARDLVRDAGTFKMLRVTIGTDKREIFLSLGAEALDADRYEAARLRIAESGMPSKPIARVFAAKGSVLLTVSDPGGLFEKVILGKADPTKYEVTGATYRLLHFSLHAPPSHPTGAQINHRLHLFFETRSRIRLAPFKAFVTTTLKRELPDIDLVVSVRNDPWYFAESYPDVFRFAPSSPFPSKEELRKSPVATCFVKGASIECAERNLR